MSAHLRRANTMLPLLYSVIITQTNLERLKIPNKFTSKYGNDLSNPVFVNPRDGTQWKVNWTEQNGGVWFQKGWKEFTQNYSLYHGHLVVFEYDGTSELDALIFEKSALEIDYPSSYVTCDERGNHDDESDDESLLILEEIPPNQKARRKLLSLSPRPHKKMRGEKVNQRTSSLNQPKDPRAQEVARIFISYNPFFTLFIKPAHLAESSVGVPTLKGYIENVTKNVKLKIGRRSWQVKLLRCHNPSSRRLGAGWPLFASESELQLEGRCCFLSRN